MQKLARTHGTSMFMVAHAAVAALLSRLGAGTDIPIGSPIAGRTDDALNDLIGFFVNTLVLRTDLSGNPSFTDLLARVRETNLTAYQHQDIPFEQLVETLNPTRSLARHPLFQTMLTYNSADRSAELTTPGLEVQSVDFDINTSRVDLSFSLTEVQADEKSTVLQGSVEYSTDLFDVESINALISGLRHVLTQVVAQPSRSLASIDV